MDAVALVESAGQELPGRHLIHYRRDLAQRGTRWACTQTSICKIVGGRPATWPSATASTTAWAPLARLEGEIAFTTLH